LNLLYYKYLLFSYYARALLATIWVKRKRRDLFSALLFYSSKKIPLIQFIFLFYGRLRRFGGGVFLRCSGQGMVSPHLGVFGVVGGVGTLISQRSRITPQSRCDRDSSPVMGANDTNLQMLPFHKPHLLILFWANSECVSEPASHYRGGGPIPNRDGGVNCKIREP
jgi:hypothetical protein